MQNKQVVPQLRREITAQISLVGAIGFFRDLQEAGILQYDTCRAFHAHLEEKLKEFSQAEGRDVRIPVFIDETRAQYSHITEDVRYPVRVDGEEQEFWIWGRCLRSMRITPFLRRTRYNN